MWPALAALAGRLGSLPDALRMHPWAASWGQVVSRHTRWQKKRQSRGAPKHRAQANRRGSHSPAAWLESGGPQRPRWTGENRQFVDTAKAAIFGAAETN